MVTGIINTANYRTELSNEKHAILADEPIALGGSDQGMTPTELLAASLIACTNITLRMYADRKEWSVDKIVTTVEFKQHQEEFIYQTN